MSKKNQEMLMERYLTTAERLAAKPEGERVRAIQEALCAAFDDGEHSKWLADMRATIAELGEGVER